jgi:phosphoribosylformimino-5-aminoimidazole carboxamide ribotide isomerase
MEIIPAIDVRGGRCVRLVQGDYARETVFADDPAVVARRWQDAGAQRLHVVDLDGARDGQPVNTAVIQRILASVFIPLQVGGGLRDLAVVRQYIEMGVERVVLGTAVVKGGPLLSEALAEQGERIAVAVDARDGLVMSEGWRESSTVRAVELIAELAALGVSHIIYTDVSLDGTLAGPNFAAVEGLLGAVRALEPATAMAVIYSGGIASTDHLLRLASLGLEGAIVGKALYTGDIDLAQALAALSA